MPCSFPPSIFPGARLLILGSMPGGESLRRGEYYAFRQNAFWKIMGELFQFSRDLSYPERLAILGRNRIALWDALESCERSGSLDSGIRNPVPNDIPGLLRENPTIVRIVCNGSAAWTFLHRYHPDLIRSGFPVMRLPSTSPAAAMISFEKKRAAYQAQIEEVCQ